MRKSTVLQTMSSKSENANTLPVLLFAWPVRLWLIPLLFSLNALKLVSVLGQCRCVLLQSKATCLCFVAILAWHLPQDFQLTLSDFSSIAGKVGSWTQCEFVLLPPTFTCFLRLARESSDGPGWLRTSCEWHFIRTNGPNNPSCTSLSLNRLRSGCRTSWLEVLEERWELKTFEEALLAEQ